MEFWTVQPLCGTQNKDAVHLALEQIDVIKRMCQSYDELELVTSSQGQKHCGQKKETSYPEVDGLSTFGKEVMKEMNRLGMIIDLAHTSETTAAAALSISKAPVVFSHSAAFSICNNSRNVPDHILQHLKENNGIVMLTFNIRTLACGSTSADVSTVADHFDFMKRIIGSEYIGIGANHDGQNIHPRGMEDVSTYPVLIEELLRRDWTEEELKGVLRENFLHVFREVKKVWSDSVSEKASELAISPEEVQTGIKLST
ncbi:dipeptidase 3-like isoform X2 [Rhineura floridana]|uniref:dipeptidase 3-like isoform X2 n=1 Tax=Rhineura floridana TaxID=261503 RepID=UPI002AC81B43|nr:dipeptidase 3-like isoform X2 [Rhineura floridana]